MKHSIEWLDDATNASDEERATVADFRLFLGGQNVTQHLLNEKLGDHVTIALYGLAEGLAHDWWSIFGCRDREFSLRRYRMGYLLPDIRMQFDGAAFEIAAHQYVYGNPSLRFWGGMSEVLSRKEAEDWLSNLIEEILGRLDARGVHDTSAALRWKRVKLSRRSAENIFCEAAGGLDLDPYRISDDIGELIEKAETIFARESLSEFVAGSGDVDFGKLVDWVERMAKDKSSTYRLSDLRPIIEGITENASPSAQNPAWVLGYRQARAMRRSLNLDQQHRFRSFRDLASLLGARKSYNLAPKVDGIVALRREGDHGVHIHVRNVGENSGAKQAHLFALARAVGDAACFPDPCISPINRLRSAYRQAAGRAFAAEFLAPLDEIRSMLEDERDELTIAAEFGVAPGVIEHQIENQDRISAACV